MKASTLRFLFVVVFFHAQSPWRIVTLAVDVTIPTPHKKSARNAPRAPSLCAPCAQASGEEACASRRGSTKRVAIASDRSKNARSKHNRVDKALLWPI